MTEPRLSSRVRLTIAVLAGATLIVAAFLAVQWRKGDPSPVSAPASVSSTPGAPTSEAQPELRLSLPPLPSISFPPSSSPAASKSAAAALAKGGFPGPGNTGPGDTKLTAWSGKCTVSQNGAVITGALINCDPLAIRATGVTIRKSKIIGSIDTIEDKPNSFTLEDSVVDGLVAERPAVGLTNMTIRRSEIYGGAANVLCYGNCDVRDSWLHTPGLAPGADWHLNGVLANAAGSGGRSDVTLIHNTISCDTRANSAGGSCSGDVSLFADFGPVSSVTARNNYFGASGDIAYCVYGGSSDKAYTSGVKNIVFTDNVFKRGGNRKCGAFGPVTSFDTSLPGNVWKNNNWDDGKPIPASN